MTRYKPHIRFWGRVEQRIRAIRGPCVHPRVIQSIRDCVHGSLRCQIEGSERRRTSFDDLRRALHRSSHPGGSRLAAIGATGDATRTIDPSIHNRDREKWDSRATRLGGKHRHVISRDPGAESYRRIRGGVLCRDGVECANVPRARRRIKAAVEKCQHTHCAVGIDQEPSAATVRPHINRAHGVHKVVRRARGNTAGGRRVGQATVPQNVTCTDQITVRPNEQTCRAATSTKSHTHISMSPGVFKYVNADGGHTRGSEFITCAMRRGECKWALLTPEDIIKVSVWCANTTEVVIQGILG